MSAVTSDQMMPTAEHSEMIRPVTVIMRMGRTDRLVMPSKASLSIFLRG